VPVTGNGLARSASTDHASIAKKNKHERIKVFRVLLTYLNDCSSIVRTFAMQALVDMATNSQVLQPIVHRHIKELTLTGTPAMKARGRKLLTELSVPTRRAAATRRERSAR
jgi:hypothetical protein